MPKSLDRPPGEGNSKNSSENQADFRNFEGTLERLLLASGASSETDLSRILGIKQPSITGARKRGAIPSGWIVAIAQGYEVSADWLLFGTGEMKRGSDPLRSAMRQRIKQGGSRREQAMQSVVDHILKPEVLLIPKVKARLNAGGGSLDTGEDVVGYYAFRDQFLKRKGNSTEMVLMDVFGDSMEPEIMDGDTVLLDQSQTEIIPGRIYAIGLGDEVVVKRLDKAPEGLVLISSNKNYPHRIVNMQGDLADVIRVIGRVLWWCREAR